MAAKVDEQPGQAEDDRMTYSRCRVNHMTPLDDTEVELLRRLGLLPNPRTKRQKHCDRRRDRVFDGDC